MQLDLFGAPPVPVRRRGERRVRQAVSGTVAVNEHGRRIGEGHQFAVLSDSEVGLLLDLREREGWSYRQLASKFEIDRGTARDYIKGRRRCQTVAGHRVVCVTQAATGSMAAC
jgi:hypothetical protein